MPQNFHVESTYYPPGWDRERLKSATRSDLTNLPTEEFRKLSDGVKEVLGSAGWNTYLNFLVQNDREIVFPETVATHVPQPRFMEVLSKLYPSMPWGFVFYRNTKCTNPEWAEYRRRFYKLIALQFSPYNDLPGVAEAKALFLISWEEDESLAEKTHQEIARMYGKRVAADSLPPGTKQTLCLSVDNKALHSLIDAALPLEGQNQARPGAPYIQAIRPMYSEARNVEEDDIDIPIHFNVAVEAVVLELFPIIGSQTLSPVELIAECKNDNVWFGMGHSGKLA